MFYMFQNVTDHMGHWKKSYCLYENFANMDICWINANVALLLCKGGPIAYVVNQLSRVLDQWILDHVIPNLGKKVMLKLLRCLVVLSFFM